MSGRRTSLRRFAVIGVLVSAMLALTGSEFADGASRTVITCTKFQNGVTKIIPAGLVAKCIKSKKGAVETWAALRDITAAERYKVMLRGSTACGGTTNNFADLNIENMMLPWCMAEADLSYVQANNADFSGVFLADANLS